MGNDPSIADHRIPYFENDSVGAYDLSITPELSERPVHPDNV